MAGRAEDSIYIYRGTTVGRKSVRAYHLEGRGSDEINTTLIPKGPINKTHEGIEQICAHGIGLRGNPEGT